MARIVLKTANRPTSVKRSVVKDAFVQAVNGKLADHRNTTKAATRTNPKKAA